nr:polyprotein [Alphaendornavirus sp.]
MINKFKTNTHTHTEVSDDESRRSLAGFTTRQLISFVGQLQDGTTYTRTPGPGFSEIEESIAWKGDILLYDHATTYILNKYGKRDTILRSRMVSNKTMQQFMNEKFTELLNLFGVANGSEHTIGTCFEIVYYFNTTFRLDYFQWFTKSEVKMTDLLVWTVQTEETMPPPRCWHLLFKTTPKTNLEFGNDEILSKRQLLQIAENNELEQTPTLELERVTDVQFAVVPGHRTAQQLIDTMTHRVRISGDYSHGSSRQKNAFWHMRSNSERTVGSTKQSSHVRSVSDTQIIVRKTEHFDNASERHRRRFSNFHIEKVPGKITKIEPMTKSSTAENASSTPKIFTNKDIKLGGSSDCWYRLWKVGNQGRKSEIKVGKLNNGGVDENGEDVMYILDSDYSPDPKPLVEVIKVSHKNHTNICEMMREEKLRMLERSGRKPKPDDIDPFDPKNTWLKLIKHDDNTVHLMDIVMVKQPWNVPRETGKEWFSLQQVYDVFFGDDGEIPIISPGPRKPKQPELPRPELNVDAEIAVAKTEKLFSDKAILGVGTSYLLRNKFLEQLELATDDNNGREYLAGITDHDERVVNNTWARSKFNFIRTSKPDRRLDESMVRELDNMIMITNVEDVADPTHNFLLDVCSSFAWLNCDPAQTEISEDLILRLSKQDWFTVHQADNPTTLITTQPKIQDVKHHDLTFIIGPIIANDNEGYLANEVGYYKKSHKGMEFSFGTTSEVHTIGWWLDLLAGENVYKSDVASVTVVSRTKFSAYQVIAVTPLMFDRLQVTESEERYFDIPIIDSGSLWATGVPLLRTIRVKLNKTLMKRLINKNLTGKVGNDTMMKYGMALSWYSYNKRGVEISNTKIDPLDIKTHVYVANVLRRRQQLTTEVEDFVTKPGINASILSAVAAMVEAKLGKMDLQNQMWVQIINQIISKLGAPVIRGNTGAEVESWNTIDFWTLRTELSQSVAGKTAMCIHHTTCSLPYTGNLCTCCLALTAYDGRIKCNCCEKKVKCTHDLSTAKDVGENDCQCCELHKTNETWCNACTPTKNRTDANVSYDYLENDEQKDYIVEFGKKKLAKRPTNTRALGDYKHEHICVKCQSVYVHTHPYHNLNHRQNYDECPNCNKKASKSKKETTAREGKTESSRQQRAEGKEEAEPSLEPPKQAFTLNLTNAELVVSLPQNAVYILRKEVSLNSLITSNPGKLSTIPFICKSHFVEPNSNFNIYQISETVGGDCGAECIRQYVGGDWSEAVAKRATGKTKSFSGIDLCNILNAYELNSAVVEDVGTHFQRVTDSEEFAVILASSAIKDSSFKEHWVIGKLKRVGYQRNPMYASPMSTPTAHEQASQNTFKLTYSQLSTEQKLLISHMLATKNVVTLQETLPPPTIVGNAFKNGNKHEMNQGKYNFSMNEQHLIYAQAFLDSLNSHVVPDVLNEIWDVSEDTSDDIELNCRHQVRDIFLTLAKLVSDPVRYCTLKKKIVSIQNKQKYIDMDGIEVKNGDMIFILTKGRYEPIFATVTGKHLKVNSTAAIDNIITLMIPKVSYMSSIMKVFACTNIEITQDKLNELLRTARLTTGFGGTGKSTLIVNRRKEHKSEKTLFVASTTGGVDSLREKLDKSESIMSFEKASYMKLKYETLIIDEATLIRPWEVALIASNETQILECYGDPMQISVLDLYSSGGARVLTDLPGRLKSLNVKDNKLVETWRFGNPLVSELNQHPVLSELRSVATHETTFDDWFLTEWNASEIIRLVGKAQVILVFYKEHVDRLKKLNFDGSIKQITTVHKYQGKEKETVAVIQAPHSKGTADTHLQLGHCVSAATRATKKLIWISISCYASNIPLHRRLGSAIAGVCFEEIESYELPKMSMDGQEVELDTKSFELAVEHVAKGEMPEGEQNLRRFDSTMFNDIIGTYTNAAQLVETRIDADEKLEMTFSLGSVINTKIKVSKDWSVEGRVPPQYKINFISAVRWSCEENVTTKLGKIQQLNKIGNYRVRIIAYLQKIYEVNNKSLKLKGDLEGYEVNDIRLDSCATCCEIVMTNTKTKAETTISKDYLRSDRRTVTGEDSALIAKVLNSAGSWNIMDEKLDDILFSHAILGERVSTWFRDIPYGTVTFTKWMYYYKNNNRGFALGLEKKLGMKIKTLEVDNMWWMPYISKKIGYCVVRTVEDGKEKYTKKLIKPRLKDLAYDVLVGMHEKYVKDSKFTAFVAKTYMNKVGAIDRLPGMVESIDWHKTRKTKVYMNITSRVGKLKLSSLKYEQKMLHIPKDVLNKLDGMHKIPNVTSSNEVALGDSSLIAAELIATYLITNTHSNETVQTFIKTPFIGYMIESNSKNGTLTNDSTQDTYNRIFASYYNKLLSNHASKYDGSSQEYKKLMSELNNRDQWTGIDESASICLVDPVTFMNYKEHRKQLSKYKTVYTWIPNKIVNSLGEIVCKFQDDSPFAVHVPKHIYMAIADGHFMDWYGNPRRLHVTRVLDGITILKISETSNSSWATPWEEGRGYVWLDVPTVIMDPRRIIDQEQLLTVTKKRYDLTVLGNLRRRLLDPGTTFDDLLVQARTLLNTSQFTTSELYDKYNINVNEMYDTARLAMKIHETENRMLSLMNSEDIQGDIKLSLTALAAEFITTILPDFKFKGLDTSIPEEYKPAISRIVFDFLNKLELLRPTLVHGRKRFINNSNINNLGLDRIIISKLRSMLNPNPIYKGGVKLLKYNRNCIECQRYGVTRFVNEVGLDIEGTDHNDVPEIMVMSPKCEHKCNVRLVLGVDVGACCYNSAEFVGHKAILYKPTEVKEHAVVETEAATLKHLVKFKHSVVTCDVVTGALENVIFNSENTTFYIKNGTKAPFIKLGSGNKVFINNVDKTLSMFVPKIAARLVANAIKEKFNLKNSLTGEAIPSYPGITVKSETTKPDEEEKVTGIDQSGQNKYHEYDDPTHNIEYDGMSCNEYGMDLKDGTTYCFPAWNVPFDINASASAEHLKSSSRVFVRWGIPSENDEDNNINNTQLIGWIVNKKVLERNQPTNAVSLIDLDIDENDGITDKSGNPIRLGDHVFANNLRHTLHQDNTKPLLLPWSVTKKTKFVIYNCNQCGCTISWPSFIKNLTCVKGHQMTVIGHPKGKARIVPYKLEITEGTYEDELEDIYEDNKYYHEDTLDSFRHFEMNNHCKALQKITADTSPSDEIYSVMFDLPTSTIGSTYHYVTKSLKPPGKNFNTFTDDVGGYKWLQDKLKYGHFRESSDYKECDDFCPMPMSMLVDNQQNNILRSAGWKIDLKTKKLYLVELTSLSVLSTYLLISALICNQPWMINVCPEGFRTIKPRWDTYSCCTGWEHHDAETKNQIPLNRDKTSFSYGTSVTNCSSRSIALIYAESMDGKYTFGVCRNSYNLIRHFIGATNHGSKALPSRLPIDTVAACLNTTSYPRHFTSYPGLQDEEMDLTWRPLKFLKAVHEDTFHTCILIDKGSLKTDEPPELSEKLDRLCENSLTKWSDYSSDSAGKCHHPVCYYDGDKTVKKQYEMCGKGDCESIYYPSLYTNYVPRGSEGYKSVGVWCEDTIITYARLLRPEFDPRSSKDYEWYKHYLGYNRDVDEDTILKQDHADTEDSDGEEDTRKSDDEKDRQDDAESEDNESVRTGDSGGARDETRHEDETHENYRDSEQTVYDAEGRDDENKDATQERGEEMIELLGTDDVTMEKSSALDAMGWINENEKHFCEVMDVTEGDEIDLPQQFLNELFMFESEPFEIYVTSKRLGRHGLARDFTEMTTTHMLNKKFTQGRRLSPATLAGLTKLRRQVIEAAGGVNETIHIYSFHEGIAERSIAINEGKHICLTTNPQKYADRGFIPIKIAKEPGRLGACLRPIICMLVPAKAIFSHGGRVNLHGLWAEAAIERVIRDDNGNFSLSAWGSPSPYMDGVVIKRKPSWKHIAEMVSTNILYGNVYGIDEASMEWLELNTCYYLKESSRMYGTWRLHPKKDEILKTINCVHISEPQNIWPNIPLKFVIRATGNTAFFPLAWKLDGDVFTVNSRGFAAMQDREFDEWWADQQLHNYKKLVMGNKTNYSPIVKWLGTAEQIQVVYNPMTMKNCVEKCLRYWLSRTDFKDVELTIQGMHLTEYSSLEQLERALFSAEINHVIVDSNGRAVKRQFTQGEFLKVQIIEQHSGLKHCVTIDCLETHMRPVLNDTIEIPTSKMEAISYYADKVKHIDSYLNGDSADEPSDVNVSLLRNAKARATGRMDLIKTRRQQVTKLNGQIATNQHVCKIDGFEGGDNVFIRDAAGWKMKTVFETDNTQYIIYEPGMYVEYGLRAACSVGYVGEHAPHVSTSGPTQKRLVQKGKSYGFLTKNDKDWAVATSHPHASKPVDAYADVIMFRNFDNRKHHNSDYLQTVHSRIPHSIIVLTKPEEPKIKLEELESLKYDGEIRTKFVNGSLDLTHISDRLDTETYNEAFKYMRVTDKIEFAKKFAIKSPFDEGKIEKEIVALAPRIKNVMNNGIYKYFTFEVHGSRLNTVLNGHVEHKYSDVVYTVEVRGVHWNNEIDMATSLLSENYIYLKVRGVHMIVSQIGKGYMQYINKETEAVQIDERTVEKFNTIDELAKPKPKPNSNVEATPEQLSSLKSVDVLNNIMYRDESDTFKLIRSMNEGQSITLYGTSHTSDPINGEVYNVPADATAMNYWDDETGMIGGSLALPIDNIRLQHRENPGAVETIRKGVLTNYPTHAQPAHTKRYAAGIQAVTDLFGKKLVLRQVEHDPVEDSEKFVNTYFIKGAMTALPEVSINHESMMEWLKERPDNTNITADVDKLLSEGLDIHGIDTVKVHMKLESRMKDTLVKLLTADHVDTSWNGMPNSIEEQRIRLIVWQRKGITALFASFFKDVKENLKRVLRKEVVYVDGMTPQQISALLNTIDGDVVFAEDDLKKQDRQTDNTLIETEMEIYKKLGANRNVVDLWRKVHIRWRAKGVGVKFTGDASRHTGQATTALGNAIVNLIVKMKIVNELGNRLQLMLVLGDDNIILTKGEITADQITKNSARHFNMQSEASVSKHCGGFLRMLIYKNNVNSLECGPDVIRLRRRFEVLNGVSEANADNVDMRAQSYAHMLGGLAPVQKLNLEKGWGLRLSKWYDWAALAGATAIKYQCTPEYVETELGSLIKMMSEQSLIIKETKIITTGKE